MKDFAKSIVCNVKAEVAKVGNADEVIHRDGDFKIKYNEKEKSYELYFNSIYYDTFHTKQQALDKIELYKRRKEARTGNSKCGNAEVFKDGDVWVVLYAEGTKSKEFKTEAEAKKFAAQVGNSVPDDMINGPAAAEIRETAARVYKKEMREDDLARATAFELAKKYKNFQKSSTFMETVKDVLKKFKTGNSKVGNKITKFGLGSYVIADGHKAVVLGETVERGPNGIPFGWVTIRWVEGPWKGQSDQQYDYDLKKA